MPRPFILYSKLNPLDNSAPCTRHVSVCHRKAGHVARSPGAKHHAGSRLGARRPRVADLVGAEPNTLYLGEIDQGGARHPVRCARGAEGSHHVGATCDGWTRVVCVNRCVCHSVWGGVARMDLATH